MFATSATISDTGAHPPVIGYPPMQLGTGMRKSDDRLLAPIALERWESEGGALPPPKRTQFEL